MCTILASSSLSITGNGSTTCRQDAGAGLEQVAPPGRCVPTSEVTSSSRIASSGGLVTCANSWVK